MRGCHRRWADSTGSQHPPRIPSHSSVPKSCPAPREVLLGRLRRPEWKQRTRGNLKTHDTVPGETHYIEDDLGMDAWIQAGLDRLERYLACWRLFTELYPADAA
jgi:hypothetical protein